MKRPYSMTGTYNYFIGTPVARDVLDLWTNAILNAVSINKIFISKINQIPRVINLVEVNHFKANMFFLENNHLKLMHTISPRSLPTCRLSSMSHLFPRIIFSTSSLACYEQKNNKKISSQITYLVVIITVLKNL